MIIQNGPEFSAITFPIISRFYFCFPVYFQFPGGLPGIPGLPPTGHPRLDLPASLGGAGSLPPPRGSDPLMSLGPQAPPSTVSHNSGPGMRPPSSNDKVILLARLGKQITSAKIIKNLRQVAQIETNKTAAYSLLVFV